MYNNFEINDKSTLIQELINNSVSLKKAFAYKESNKKINLIELHNNYTYFIPHKKYFKSSYIPVQNLLLKNKHFLDLKISIETTKIQNQSVEKENLKNLFAKKKKKFILLSTKSPFNIKYKSILSKLSEDCFIDSFLEKGTKKNLFLKLNNNFSVIRGSVHLDKKKFSTEIKFPETKKNFVKSKKRKVSSFKINQLFEKKKKRNIKKNA